MKMKINGRKIKELMVINGWNTSDIAEKAGLSRPTISKGIHGGDMAPASITKLYNALNIELDELVDWGHDG